MKLTMLSKLFVSFMTGMTLLVTLAVVFLLISLAADWVQSRFGWTGEDIFAAFILVVVFLGVATVLGWQLLFNVSW